MKIEFCEALHLDERGDVSFAQLIEYSGLPEGELRELIAYGALSPLDPAAPSWTFSASTLGVARAAERLRHDFELDANALSLLLSYAERIHELEEELRALRAGVVCRR
jgi:chaperone modulatory protein CbpM